MEHHPPTLAISGPAGGVPPAPRALVPAVDGVDLTVPRGTIVGLVGESGCGKSTIGRLILGLHQSTSGEILFNGQDICKMNKKQLHDLRKDLQIIFQDPFSSLNPRMSIGEIIGEPLRIHAKAQSVRSCSASSARPRWAICCVSIPALMRIGATRCPSAIHS